MGNLPHPAQLKAGVETHQVEPSIIPEHARRLRFDFYGGGRSRGEGLMFFYLAPFLPYSLPVYISDTRLWSIYRIREECG